jgi:hypothetical protein
MKHDTLKHEVSELELDQGTVEEDEDVEQQKEVDQRESEQEAQWISKLEYEALLQKVVALNIVMDVE